MSNKISPTELSIFKQSGRILSDAMKAVVEAIKPGMPTLGLEEIAETEIRRQGGQPSFKNYQQGAETPFPAALCISINNEVVHGAPKKDKVVKNGDIVSLDLGCQFKGMFTDMAVTVGVGKISQLDQKLIDVTKKSLQIGIDQAKIGKTTGNIGSEIESYVLSQGFNVVKDLVGHGVGHKVHEEPSVPNFGRKGTGTKIEEGMGLAIEPMVNIGRSEIYVAKDGWTIMTSDGKKSAHFEKTIYVSKKGPIVITPFN
jgi:methionyl aminopeptidase